MRIVVAVGCGILALLALAWLLSSSSGTDSTQPVAAPSPASTGPARPAASPEPETADPSLPVTQLPLRLVATVVREDRKLSLATVEDLELSSHQVLSEGQSFTAHPRATLVEIERGRVILDNDGVREQLLLDRSHRASADIPPEEREYRRDLATRLRDITDAGEDYLDRGERTGLLAEGDPTPIYEDGELVGVRIDNVRPDGFYDHFGVKDGDVLRSINGVRMNDTAGLLKELAVADEFVVDVDRADGTSGQVTGLGEEVRNMMGDLQ